MLILLGINILYLKIEMNCINKERYSFNPILIITLFYTISYFMMLFNLGVFWDDWSFYNSDFQSIKFQWTSFGAPFRAYIYHFFGNDYPQMPLIYHVLTFSIYLFSSYVTYYTYIQFFKEQYLAFLYVLFLSIIPFNHARIMMVCFPYTLGFFFCTVGMYFFIRFWKSGKIQNRLYSLLFQTLSFILVNSSYFFIPVLICLFLLHESWENNIFDTLKILIKKFKRIPDFIILPLVLFLIFNKILFPQTGLYENYNTIGFSIRSLSPDLIKSFIISNRQAFFQLIDIRYYCTDFWFVVFLLMTVSGYYMLSRVNYDEVFNGLSSNEKLSDFGDSRFILSSFAGLGLFIAASIPYIVVGKIKVDGFIRSRHQIFWGIGISILLIDVIFILCMKIKRRRKQKIVLILAIILSIFITNNLYFSVDSHRAYLIMESIKMNARDELLLKQGGAFTYKDNIDCYLWNNTKGFYIYSGIFKDIFGDETRIIINSGSESKWTNIDPLMRKGTYHFEDVVFDGHFDYAIDVSQNKSLSSFKVFELLLYKLFFYDNYNIKVKNLTSMKIYEN